MTAALENPTLIKNLGLDETVGFIYSIPCKTDEPEIVFMAAYGMPNSKGATSRVIWNAVYNSANNSYEWYVRDVKSSGIMHGSGYRIYRQPDPFRDESRVMDQAGRLIFK